LATRELKTALKSLLIEQGEPQIVAIKGSWGTGKTYFWKDFAGGLHDHKTAYVSLFGLTNVDQLKQAINVSLIPSGEREARRYIRPILGLLSKIKYRGIGLPTNLLNDLVLARILRSTQIVCLDDFERTSIDHEHLLGYANTLRDEHRVNVVLIYNEDQLSPDDVYHTYREKVIDRELPFRPDLEEVVGIAVDEADLRHHVLEHCRKLNLSNIRVIRRALQCYQEIIDQIGDEDPGTLAPQALHSLLLFSLIKFSSQAEIGSLEELERYSEMSEEIRLHTLTSNQKAFAEDVDTASEEAAARRMIEFLHSYGYIITDDFDNVLLEFIREGIVNTEALDKAIRQHQEGKTKADKEAKLRVVWDMFNHSYQDNEAELIETLMAAAGEHIDVLSLNDVDNFLWLLKRLGQDGQAEELRKRYLDEHGDRIREWEDPHDFSRVRDDILAAQIRTLRESAEDGRTLPDILEAVLLTDSWHSRDVERLNQFSSEDFEQYFESSEGPPVGDYAKALARFASRFANPDKDQVEIERKATEALKRIAAKSAYNRARIERYVKFDEVEEPQVGE
jgi:archaellum biogenesis ATPase FlaH